jgi:hypothetical protein
MIVKFTMATQHTCPLTYNQCGTVTYGLIEIHQVPKRVLLVSLRKLHLLISMLVCSSSEVEVESPQRGKESGDASFYQLGIREVGFDEDELCL